MPVNRDCVSVTEAHERIARLVTELEAKGLADRDITVHYPCRERDRIDRSCGRLRETGTVCWVSNEADPNGDGGSLSRPGVRLMTIRAAKGWSSRR